LRGSANASAQLANDQITNFTVKVRLLPESYRDLSGKGRQPFRPGMSASVDIQTNRIDNILAVPIQAVTTREDTLAQLGKKTDVDAQDTKSDADIRELVFVYDQGKVYQKPVRIGIQDETYMQILSGLQGGEEVVSAPYRTIAKVLKDSLAVERVSKEELYKKEE
jgi:HlyD family secretion protein